MKLESTKDRRAVYRTVPESENALEVELKSPTGELVAGEVADVSSCAAEPTCSALQRKDQILVKCLHCKHFTKN